MALIKDKIDYDPISESKFTLERAIEFLLEQEDLSPLHYWLCDDYYISVNYKLIHIIASAMYTDRCY